MSGASAIDAGGLLPDTASVNSWTQRVHEVDAMELEEGFHAPLDLVDGAARVYDPIVRGGIGRGSVGVFLEGLLEA